MSESETIDILRDLITELQEHLDYIGWGDSYEREKVLAPGGLRDRTEAILSRLQVSNALESSD